MKYVNLTQLLTLASFSISSMLLADQGELRCNGSLIEEGMNSHRVKSICGEPAASDSRETAVRSIDKNNKEKDAYDSHDAWLYDTDPGSFLRVVSFEHDRVVKISVLDRMGSDSPHSNANCESAPTKVKVGVEAVFVKYLCGNPSRVNVLSDEFVPVNKEYKGKTQSVLQRLRVELWQFNLKGKSLRVKLRGGIVTHVE